MKLFRLLTLAASLTAALSNTQAKDTTARLMLKSDGPADIQVIGNSDNAKLIDPQAKAITVEVPANANQWSTGSIKFKVSADTDLRLRLSSNYTKTEEKWVFIDNVKGEGVQVENPDFESAGANGPNGWKFLQNGKGKAVLLQDDKAAASGQGFVKVSHTAPVVQVIHVPKDTEVTLSFSAKAASAK